MDNDRPYIGQQIAYVLRIYQRSDFTKKLRYIPPSFAGLWNSQTTQRYEYTETIGPEQYRVIELRTLLFPSVVETITIEPASLRADAGLPGGSELLESDPVVVSARALPAGAPPGFVGAVGRFEISAEVNATTGTVNEPVLLTVNITGDGNVEALPDPAWPEFLGWRAIESPPAAEASVVDGKITGIRTYEFGLVPEESGDLTIPEIVYPHYDPEADRYVQARTVTIVVTIEGADGVSPLVSDDAEGEQSCVGSEGQQACSPGARTLGERPDGYPVLLGRVGCSVAHHRWGCDMAAQGGRTGGRYVDVPAAERAEERPVRSRTIRGGWPRHKSSLR